MSRARSGRDATPRISRTHFALLILSGLLATLVAAGVLAVESFEWVPVAILGTWLMTTAVVGALVFVGRPGNPVGPLMMWGAFGVAVAAVLFDSYASYSIEFGGESLPGTKAVAWLTLWTTIPAFSLFIHLFLRFPTGVLPSRRWRWVSRLTTFATAATCVGYALREGPIDSVKTMSNPLGSLAPAWVSDMGISVGDSLLPVSGFLAVASLFVRYRRAQRLERQQMKWFILAVSVFPVLFLIAEFTSGVDESEDQYFQFLLIVAALLFVPVSMGIGILKHRLYDIDVVLNRALVYTALTGVLGAAYLGAVVVLQRLLGSFTQESDLAIAGSTLAVAALFRPVRSRVQSFIDRRFYRRKYDATETLGAFSARLRDQVDLDALGQELVAVVGSTMQPAHASLWLRSQEAAR